MNRRLIRLAMIGMLFALVAAPTWAQNVCDGISPLNNTSLNGILVVSSVSDPVALRSIPGDTDRLFIVQRNGIILVHNRGDAPNVNTTYMNIDARVDSASFNEMGLLGLAFHPDFENNKFFYVNYTDNFGNTIVSRFTEAGGLGNASSEKLVLSFSQPEANHNGGDIHFGPHDGYLYIATGDGGGGGDQHGSCGNGQNTGNLLGKILRVDVDGLAPNARDCSSGSYSIPDNDLVDGPGGDCDEIFAYGLRNPWRFSFDRDNGDMYVGDVGQGCWEEVNWTTPAASNGANFGWRQMEGMHCYNPGSCNPASAAGCSPACNDPSLILPVHETDSTGECTVIGGFNYRGCRMPNFESKYFWGDYCSAYIKSFEVVGGLKTNEETWTSQVEVGTSLASNDLSSFGTDAEGELYYTDRDGQVILITAPLADFQVSGAGVADADQLLLNGGAWSWEDLQYSSQYPIDSYNIHRADSANGIFDCIHTTASTSWTGDPASPAIGSGFYYVVVAETAAGELTGAGGSRTLGAACP